MPVASRDNRPIHLVALLLLVAATFAVYGQILGHQFIPNWDDSLYVTDNPHIQAISWDNIRTVFSSYYVGNYAPLQMLSYMLDYALWGEWAGGFLLTNLLIHTANGLLFYRLLLRMHADRLLALIGAALFLLHPVQVESVAWVSQRKNLLAMLFFLLAWEGYRRYRDAEAGRGRVAYLAAVTCFSLALLSKSVVVIFPVVLILFDACFPVGNARVRLKDKLPFVLAAMAVAALALVSQQAEHGGGRSAFHGGTPLATLYSMLPVLCRYLGLLVWPSGLSAEYDPVIYQSVTAAVVAALLVLTVVVVACGILLVRERRLGFWAVLFFVGLLPVSQIVPLVTLINDRYLYFPLLGFAALCAGCVAHLSRRCTPPWDRLLLILPAGLLVLLAVSSWQRARVWQDDLSLWSDAVARYPGKASLRSALGDAYLNHGRLDEARQSYELALRLNPGEATALLNLGILHSQAGQLPSGQRMLKEVLRIEPRNFRGWANLGNTHVLLGEYREAEQAYKRALELQPDELKIVGLLGNAALLQRDPGKARDYFLRLEAKSGSDPEVACGLARAEALAGHPDQAERWLETALKRGLPDLERLNGFSELESVLQSPAFREAARRHASETVPR